MAKTGLTASGWGIIHHRFYWKREREETNMEFKTATMADFDVAFDYIEKLWDL